MAEELPNVNITQGSQKKVNPLVGFYRQPKIYVKLPSKGEFYPEDALDKSETGDYPVFAMTAKDELLLKTPDALLSGQSTVEVIKSCVPAITNPWKMPTIDVDAVLIAIRIATYGETMDVFSTCSQCKEENKYGIELTKHLNVAQSVEYPTEIQVEELIVHLKPYNYKQLTETNVKVMEQQRLFNIVNDEKLSDAEKLEKFGKSFSNLTEMTVEAIVGCIERIDAPTGSTDDKEYIREFINNTSKEVFQSISNVLNDMKEKTTIPEQKVKCEKCEHEYSMPVTLDQSNFFADRS